MLKMKFQLHILIQLSFDAVFAYENCMFSKANMQMSRYLFLFQYWAFSSLISENTIYEIIYVTL